jgi:single-strand DNA-binding protein
MQKTVIIGNLGQDAQVKTTQQGAQYLAFSVAVSEKRNQQEVTTWFSCSGWGERFLGAIVPHLKKGTKVYIEGKYQPSLYTQQDGTIVISHNLMINHIELLGGVQQQQGVAQPQQGVAQPQQPNTAVQRPVANVAQPVANVAQPKPQPAYNPYTAQAHAAQQANGNPVQGANQGWTAGSGHSDDNFQF